MLKDLSEADREKILRGVKTIETIGGVLTEDGKIRGYGRGYGHSGHVTASLEPEPDGTKLVFTWGERKFYGSTYHKVDPFDKAVAFVVDLSNKGWPAGSKTTITQKIAVDGHKLPEGSLEVLKDFLTFSYDRVVPEPCPHLKIDWPDFKALGANTDFWEYLIQMLPDGKIIINCQGGKGRTGTALSALWMAANALTGTYVSAGDAVALVRKNHHGGAVESKEQADYLNALAKEWKAELEEKK